MCDFLFVVKLVESAVEKVRKGFCENEAKFYQDRTTGSVVVIITIIDDITKIRV